MSASVVLCLLLNAKRSFDQHHFFLLLLGSTQEKKKAGQGLKLPGIRVIPAIHNSSKIM